MSPDFSGAPCIGRAELFESTHLADHHEARELCVGCSAIEACAMLLREVREASWGTRNAGGGPAGTWAGELVGAAPIERPRRGRTKPREHSTDRGYYQHRWYRERACDACRIAHAATVREASLL